MESNAGDPYASIWNLCKTPSFQLPQSPPQPHPTATDRLRLEYCLFGPIPQHLLSHYLCFRPTPPNNLTNSPSLRDSQSPINSINSDPHLTRINFKNNENTTQCVDSNLSVAKNDQNTTRPCCNVCYEDDSVPDQGYSGFSNDVVSHENQRTDAPILCVMNYQDSLPLTPREEERTFRAGDPYGESSILLLEELKELALWDQDCVMDNVDAGFMVSVMSMFRKLAFIPEAISRHELKAKKPHKISGANSVKYFTRSMLAKPSWKKSKGKQKEFQDECEANVGSGSLKFTDENVQSLGDQNMKRVGSFSHGHSSVEHSKPISKARKTLLVDLDEPLLKKPKHSLDANCMIHVI